MTKVQDSAGWTKPVATAVLVLADGTVIEGMGVGAVGHAAGEVCFNTAMTGYQEILTDPSYSGQIVTFTFPHIGNVGVNEEDSETVNPAASAGVRGMVVHAPISDPANFRATRHLDQWLKARDIIGISGVDTRALTALIREKDQEMDTLETKITAERNVQREEASESFQVIGDANRRISSTKAELGVIETKMQQLYSEIGRHVSLHFRSDPRCQAAVRDHKPLVEVMVALRKSIILNQKLAEFT